MRRSEIINVNLEHLYLIKFTEFALKLKCTANNFSAKLKRNQGQILYYRKISFEKLKVQMLLHKLCYINAQLPKLFLPNRQKRNELEVRVNLT